eukprot:7423568-Prorocentrum_lima.AAC.1
MLCSHCHEPRVAHVWCRAIHREESQGWCQTCWDSQARRRGDRYAQQHLDTAAAPDACPLCSMGEAGSEHLLTNCAAAHQAWAALDPHQRLLIDA